MSLLLFCLHDIIVISFELTRTGDKYSMIDVSGLIFDYPKMRALKNLSFSIQPGTITALVGPNGAGKTTLMKCLAGLDKPFAGSITVNGVDVIANPRESHTMVGFLPDFFGLYDNLSVHQALSYYAALANIPDTHVSDAVETSAKRLWIDNKLQAQVKALSRGMRQRLAIAQAIIRNPKLLLLDEPAAGLDPESRYELSSLFRQLRSEGMTLVVSSHILSELEQYADNLIIMHEGRILPHEAGTDNTRTRVSLRVLSDKGSAIDTIKPMAGVLSVSEDGERIIADISGGAQECRDLLKQVVDKGCEVYDFSMVKKDMQSEYMRVIEMCRGGN